MLHFCTPRRTAGEFGRRLQTASSWLEGGDVGTMGTKGFTEEFDQFKVHAQMTGRKSTYDETLYTTALPAGQLSEAQLKAAERTATEINSQATTNLHIAEERGQTVAGLEKYDPEDRYSGVLTGDDGSDRTIRPDEAQARFATTHFDIIGPGGASDGPRPENARLAGVQPRQEGVPQHLLERRARRGLALQQTLNQVARLRVDVRREGEVPAAHFGEGVFDADALRRGDQGQTV